MKKAAHLLRRFEFHLLLFFLGMLAFAKPTLIPSPNAPPSALLLAYFVPWVFLIGMLWAISRSGPEDDDDENPGGDSASTPPQRD